MRLDAFVRLACCGLLLASLCAQTSEGGSPKVAIRKINGSIPAKGARIIKYYVDQPPDSGHETGNLHIVYNEKTEVIAPLMSRENSAEQNAVFKPRGIENVKVGPDNRTIGWAVLFDWCCTSYPIPLTLSIYRSRDTILRISQGQMLWYWTFRDGGKRVAAAWGTTHGPQIGDFQLYDVRTGRMVSEVFGDPETQSLRADAPEWAKETERQMSDRGSR